MVEPETDQKRRDRESRELEGKNIAFYSVLLETWIENRMERDRTLVTLSAGGIGLLVTIIAAFGIRSICELVFYGMAIIGFVVTIILALVIYQKNSKEIEASLRGTEPPNLKPYDQCSWKAFIFAIVCTVCAAFIGVLHASPFTNINRSAEMSQEKQVPVNEQDRSNQDRIEYKSLHGLAQLRPNLIQPTSTTNQTSTDANQGKPPANTTLPDSNTDPQKPKQ